MRKNWPDRPLLFVEILRCLPDREHRLFLIEAIASLSPRPAPPAALSNTQRIRERDQLIRNVVAGPLASLPATIAARRLADELRRAAMRWPAELPAQCSELRRVAHEILTLNNGKLLAWRRLHEIAQG